MFYGSSPRGVCVRSYLNDSYLGAEISIPLMVGLAAVAVIGVLAVNDSRRHIAVRRFAPKLSFEMQVQRRSYAATRLRGVRLERLVKPCVS